MSNLEQPLSKAEMIEAIVAEVQYWDLEVLIDWVQEEMGKMLEAQSYETVYEEYTFYFEED